MIDDRRAQLRCEAKNLTALAQISIPREEETIDDMSFKTDATGLTVEESRSGCGFVTLANKRLKVNKTCFIATGSRGLMKARVVWSEPLNDIEIMVGCQYLD